MTTTSASQSTSTSSSDAGAVRSIDHWIDNAFVSVPEARTGDVYNPATGAVQARVQLADAATVDRAVASAHAAFQTWRNVPLSHRARIMFKAREIFHARQDQLQAMVTSEHGKVVDDAAGEVARGLEVIEFACGIPHLIKGEFAEAVSTGIDAWSIRQPVGVVAGITPFNFPAMVPLWMIPIAIACGNTFVLKPSEKDPTCANLIAEWFAEAGLPAGVLNVVHGDAVAVNALLDNKDVSAFSSVSSTPVAKHIHQTASANGKRVQALGGAKNHMVVLPDADMELAADAVVGAAYGSAGQRCMAISVLVAVGESTAEQMRQLILDRVAELKIGNGADASSQMGPVITPESKARIVEIVDGATAAGAELVVNGNGLSVEGCESGFFVGPTLIDKVAPGMRAYDEEIFGPVLAIVRVDSYDEAVKLINANEFANGVAIFTRDGGVAREFQHEIEVGMVGINVPIPVPMAYFSFGGWKNSLFGDTHMHGMEGVRFFTRAKAITGRWPDPRQRGVNLGFPQT